MSAKFLFEEYLASNEDLKSTFPDNSALPLETHYQNYGRNELRGYSNIDSTLSIEVAITSLSGDVFLSGWINRKLHSEVALTIRVGYEEFEIPHDSFAFYRRDDVCKYLEEPDVRAAFVCLFSIGNPIRATEVSFRLGQRQGMHARAVQPLSNEAFLNAVLVRSAYIAQLPSSNSYAPGAFLSRALAPVWSEYLSKVTYSEVYTSRKVTASRTEQISFVTVLYNDLTLFRLQHMLMSKVLPSHNVEWVIVLNKTDGLDAFLREVAAIDQLVPFAIRVVAASSNAGFSAANNHGASIARSGRIALVNPDIFPNPSCSVPLTTILEQTVPSKTLVGAQLVYGTGALMHDGMFIAEDHTYDEDAHTRRTLLRVEHFGKGSVSADTQTPRMRMVPATSGAFWIMNQDSFFSLGALSTDYIFAHYEDADFCLRIWEQGGDVRVFEPAVLTHLEGVGSHNSPVGMSTRWLNRLKFSERWRGSYESLSARSIAQTKNADPSRH
jgi:GT2 family glycosyltransferase